MRPVILVMYAVMALWLFVVSALRVLLSMTARVALDALPFVTGGLGLVALLIVVPAAARAVLTWIASRSGRIGAGSEARPLRDRAGGGGAGQR